MAGWGLYLGLLASAALACAIGLLIVAAFPMARRPQGSIFLAEEEGAVFLFDGETLVDANPQARALLSRSHLRGGPFTQLTALLSRDFPGFAGAVAGLSATGLFQATAAPAHGASLVLDAELRGGLTRIALQDVGVTAGLAGPDPMIHRAMADEIGDLRHLAAEAPLPVWRERSDGAVIWANAAYLAHVTAQLAPGEETGWPLPRLFERTASAQGAAGQRQSLTLPGGKVLWFDLAHVSDGEGRILYALPADAAVQAERSLRDFVQILTQTFAHLPIGLAIFDRGRQLHMFNPALLDLTGLPADFLSLRPSLLSVLDALRDTNMLPEPRDYRGWRRQMLEMEKAAAAGLYEEMWSLSGGQTYRVMARPHPNGGLALMIEDVSVETLRTRRYRAALEMHQAVVDAMDEAVAVFAPDGELVSANPAYAALWGGDPAAGLSRTGFRACCRDWRAATTPDPIWDRAAEFAVASGARRSCLGEARLNDGRLLRCRFLPLPGGATLAGFTLAENGKDERNLSGRRGADPSPRNRRRA